MPPCQYKYCRSEKFCKVQPCNEIGNEPCFKPYPPKMTDYDFAKKSAEILDDIPKEFHAVLSYMAYERGHSSGNEEVLLILDGLVYDLKEPIEQFEKRITSNNTP